MKDILDNILTSSETSTDIVYTKKKNTQIPILILKNDQDTKLVAQTNHLSTRKST